MTTEEACDIILNEADDLLRMPHHARARPISRRDYIRGRLLLMVARDTVYGAEYAEPEEPKPPLRH